MDPINLEEYKKEKKLKRKIAERLEEDKSQTLEYKYLHYVGSEPNFAMAQKQNKTIVTRSKVEGDYEFFNGLFQKWNKLVRYQTSFEIFCFFFFSWFFATFLFTLSGGPFAIKANEGKLFAVHNMGPYKTIKLDSPQSCHGCGSDIEKGLFLFFYGCTSWSVPIHSIFF